MVERAAERERVEHRERDHRSVSAKPAARARSWPSIKKVEVLEDPDVVDFPALVVVDDKGNDLFAGIAGGKSGKGLPVAG
jgi:hypothetical protein